MIWINVMKSLNGYGARILSANSLSISQRHPIRVKQEEEEGERILIVIVIVVIVIRVIE